MPGRLQGRGGGGIQQLVRRSGGGILAQEVRSALYDLADPPYLMAATIGLGGRAVTIPYWVALFRMLADVASGKPETRTHLWLKENAPGHSFVLGTRGNPHPKTDAAFDIPLMEEGVRQIAVVGKGGQGLLQLNSVFTGVASIRGQYALSMAGFGGLAARGRHHPQHQAIQRTHPGLVRHHHGGHHHGLRRGRVPGTDAGAISRAAS